MCIRDRCRCLCFIWSDSVDVYTSFGQTVSMSMLHCVRQCRCLCFIWSDSVDVYASFVQTTSMSMLHFVRQCRCLYFILSDSVRLTIFVPETPVVDSGRIGVVSLSEGVVDLGSDFEFQNGALGRGVHVAYQRRCLIVKARSPVPHS